MQGNNEIYAFVLLLLLLLEEEEEEEEERGMCTLDETGGLDEIAVSVSGHDDLIADVRPLSPSVHHTRGRARSKGYPRKKKKT
jgi:hypothetical protein